MTEILLYLCGDKMEHLILDLNVRLFSNAFEVILLLFESPVFKGHNLRILELQFGKGSSDKKTLEIIFKLDEVLKLK